MTMSSSTSTHSRTTILVNSKLETSLLGYVAAAGAAGVALLAAAQPAQAKIVYTPMNNVPLTSLTSIDVNGDGVADINFLFFTSGYGAEQVVYAGAGGAIIVGTLNNSYGPAPLPWLTRIGFKNKFGVSNRYLAITGVDGCHSFCNKFGIWQHEVDKYIGFKFMIAGQPHFGWMRLVVQGALTGYASGYAYEDVPGQPITAGKTSGPEVAEAFAPDLTPAEPMQTLGMLARGNDGLALWRRKENALAA
jgi:hypothetical protein